uniref:Integral membrane protein 2 n=2 Tax=Parascaris univalens TaxID=6257 RepID=A0A915AL46_PARUN
MSTSDESELTESNKKPTEILDDDVTLISISNPYGQLRSIMLRLLLAIIFLGVGVGAVVYSVYSSERNANAEDTNVTTVDYFNIRVNQICDKGLYIIETIVNVTSDGEVVKRDVTTIGASWMQDDTHQRLYLRLGLSPDDWIYTDFVHPTFTVRSAKYNCTKNYGVTYDSYIKNFGVDNLHKSLRRESVLIDGKYQPVIVYSGVPATNILMHGLNPVVMFAYMNPNSGATYGLETFFPRTGTSFLFRTELWFANMTIGPPDASVFFNYPSECEFSVVNVTSDAFLQGT